MHRVSLVIHSAQWLIVWRLGLVRKLLRRGLPVKQVAVEVGYANASALERWEMSLAIGVRNAGRATAACVLACMGAALFAACATPRLDEPALQLPLQVGWFEGDAVFYVTTDVSDAEVAKAKNANFAPRLADALTDGATPPQRRSAVDKVYAVTNFVQPSVFASAPLPMGHLNRDPAYSPLWRMVTVTWKAGHEPRALTSEEAVLAAEQAGAVRLQATRVVLNCPIVHRGARGALPGAALVGWPPATARP